MIDMTAWLEEFQRAQDEHFGSRVWFVGLQGSYARQEATENSDIDIVVILDELSPQDIRTYEAMLDALPHREKICGFLSGREELLRWEPSDLFQFYYDTQPVRGSLDVLLPLLDRQAVERAICIGACNIYHGCVHNMLHEKSEEVLKALYKSASFVMQADCFVKTGSYVQRQTELLERVEAEDRRVIEVFLALKKGEPVCFEEMSDTLFVWAQKQIKATASAL